MLKSDSNPTKPAAIAATAWAPAGSSAFSLTPGWPIKVPPKISCNIGDAIAITPMPADTLRHSTTQISQNWGVLCASFRCTLRWVMSAFLAAGGVQPSGTQLAGGTR